MKKMIFAALALLSVGFVANGGFFGRRNNGCCPTRTRCATTSCVTPCAKPAEPCPPKCCKTVMVDQVIQVPKVIEVPARRIEIPQPDIREEIPQPCKVVMHPQPPCIRYECPSDCD